MIIAYSDVKYNRYLRKCKLLLLIPENILLTGAESAYL